MSRIPASRKATDSSDQQSSSSQQHSAEVQAEQSTTTDHTIHPEEDKVNRKSDSNNPSTSGESIDPSSNRSFNTTNQEFSRTDEREGQTTKPTSRPSPSISSLLSDPTASERKLKGQQSTNTASDDHYAQESHSSRLPPNSNVSTQHSSLSSSPRASKSATPSSERSIIPSTEQPQSFYPSADQFSRAYTETQFTAGGGSLSNETQQVSTSQQYTTESYVPQAAFQRRLNQQKSISRPTTSRRHSLSGMSRVRNGRKYRLVVVQHPERARMCGFGDKVSMITSLSDDSND